MTRKLTALMVLCAFLVPTALLAQHAEQEKAAAAAANTWLHLVDSGQYAESWKEASAMVRAAVPEQEWAEKLQAARKPLGALVTRDLKKQTYATSLPGAPDGEYVVMQFQTSFQNKKSAIETVTAMLEKDGAWRIAGYYIR